MGYLDTMRTSSSALGAQRMRMDLISNNLANAETTRTASGGAYRRQQAVFASQSFDSNLATLVGAKQGPLSAPSLGQGVRVAGVAEDRSPGRLVYQPDHPDANPNGYVEYPNVNIVTEMIDMMSATRSYEANVTALNAAKGMAMKALEIGRA